MTINRCSAEMSGVTMNRRSLNSISADYFAAAMDWRRYSGAMAGYLPERENKLKAGLQIALNSNNIFPPPFFFIGQHSAAAMLFGNAYTQLILNRFSDESPDVEKSLAQAYAEVAGTNEAIYHRVHLRFTTANDQALWAVYDRLLVSVSQTDSPLKWFYCFTQLKNTFRVFG